MPQTPLTSPEVALFIKTYSRYGGVEQFCHRFHCYLRARGVAVRVYCGEAEPGAVEELNGQPTRGENGQGDAPERKAGAAPLPPADIRVLGLWRPGRFLKNLGLHRATAQALRELPPGVVSVSFGNIAGCHIHRSGGPHLDFLKRSLQAQRTFPRKLRKALRRALDPNNLLMPLLDRLIYSHPNTSRIIAISRDVEAAIRRQFPNAPATTLVIPNGVDKKRFSVERFAALRGEARQAASVSEGQRAVGFCSSNFELKGLDRLVAAMARLPDDHVLLVAGGRRAKKYEDYAKSLGVAGRVKFLGKVDDMPAFYAALDVFCHPSFYDTFGNVVAEALAMGVPVTTTRMTGACDLVDEGRSGHVLDRPDPDLLAEAILDLKRVPAGTDFAGVQDDEQVFARYLAVIEDVRAELASSPNP